MENNKIYIVAAVAIIVVIIIALAIVLSNTGQPLTHLINTTTVSTGSNGALTSATASNLSGALNVSQPQDINYTSNQNVSGSP